MKIIYCNVGKSNYYNGEKLTGGGSFNDEHIGGEANNFTNHNGKYFGYARNTGDTIDICRFGASPDDEYAENVLVIWLFNKKTVCGYYKNARVYRTTKENLPKEIAAERLYNFYNITVTQENAVLIPPEKRTFQIDFRGHNVWYGDKETNKKILEYIEEYESESKIRINKIENFSDNLIGKEKEALVRIRLNQGKFREIMLEKHKRKCSICGVTMSCALIASHIKPWAESSMSEKLSENNGLLLCPNHDKLFDMGYISFDDDGRIMISDELDEKNRIAMNVNASMELSRDTVSSEMKAFLKYHRNNIFRIRKSFPLRCRKFRTRRDEMKQALKK